MANKIVGTPGDDVLKGTNKKDIIKGKGGNDIIKGKGGNDVLKGGKGNDLLKGGGGDDVLKGQGGDDDLIGSKGNDLLLGNKGSDWCWGGEGADIFKFNSGDGFHVGFPALPGTGVYDDLIWDFEKGGTDLLDIPDASPTGFTGLATLDGAAFAYAATAGGVAVGSFFLVDVIGLTADDFI